MRAIEKLLQDAEKWQLEWLDHCLARQFSEWDENLEFEQLLAIGLLSQAMRQGHVCLPMALCQAHFDTALNTAEWRQRWLLSAVCSDDLMTVTPLFLDPQNRLYLRRYYCLEQDLAEAIWQRLNTDLEPVAAKQLQAMQALMPSVDPQQAQSRALAVAAQQALCLVSGGPGTGKTWTVARLISLLQSHKADLRIALTAPTGKAVARLRESLQLASDDDATSGLAQQDLTTATLHRLLQINPRTGQAFFHTQRCLPFDLIIVDEASMADLPMMRALFLACARDCRLILLGDRHQLASVENGAVFAELSAYSELKELAAVQVKLTYSHRFSVESALGQLAQAILNGQLAQCQKLLLQEDTLKWQMLHATQDWEPLHKQIRQQFAQAYRHWSQAASAAEALAQFQQFSLLCAQRRGIYGSETLNLMLDDYLAEIANVERTSSSTPYHGQALMVLQNRSDLELYNGDIGMVWQNGQELEVWFAQPQSDSGWQTIPLWQMPEHEPAYAITIHKSQGSEFNEVWVLLGDRSNPLHTRELLYTAVTRSRGQLRLWAANEVLAACVQHQSQRHNGLLDALKQRITHD